MVGFSFLFFFIAACASFHFENMNKKLKEKITKFTAKYRQENGRKLTITLMSFLQNITLLLCRQKKKN